jgi:hypothetical protein
MPAIHTTHTLKTVREALNVAQTAIGVTNPNENRDAYLAAIGSLIADIDGQRPLGLDGKHDSRHTPTCGCEDSMSSPDAFVMPQPLVRPLDIPLTRGGVQEAWDAFVKPKQDSGELQSVEDRVLMAILRAAYVALPDSPQGAMG